MMTRIGDLRRRVTLQSQQQTRDEDGMVNIAWVDVATVWASIVSVSGKEYFSAAAVNAETDKKVTIRYRSDVDSSWRVMVDGQVNEVIDPLDEDGTRRFLTLMCKAVMTG
ncbi:phage head closure protein [Alicyclobacillus fodiniaquatilis]|uniref:Phage head closure protein n=1 Tax=Alicyclobacillus fodiniaquatilis TaxID=1661150 RepID=A0ABW4JIW6_9BACL